MSTSPEHTVATAERRGELAANLAAVRERLTRAAHQAQRDPAQLRLVVVTKYFPRSDVDALIELGVRDLGRTAIRRRAPS